MNIEAAEEHLVVVSDLHLGGIVNLFGLTGGGDHSVRG
jgi:hypothetical protein